MILYENLKSITDVERTAVALGNFDGLHLGHTELIRRTVSSAHMSGLKSAVFTFPNHPQNAITGRSIVKNIITPKEKIRLIRDLGVDYLFSIPFDDTFHKMPAVDFADDLLSKTFRAAQVFCGFNFRFGRNAEGDGAVLTRVASQKGFKVNILDAYMVEGEVVSSTLIRGLIAEGDMEEIDRYLGRPYSVPGTVITGNRLGGKLGFPTANIALDENMIQPSRGVYATLCTMDGTTFESVSNIGVRPTIGDGKKLLETHIFGHEGELYGEKLRITFLKKLRDERTFDSVEALAAQVALDKETSKAYHYDRR
jgi:riboflavin kinase/FMN adenylyltransferase